MNLNKLILIGDTIERLSEHTDTCVTDILELLEGVILSEEDVGRLRDYFQHEEDV